MLMRAIQAPNPSSLRWLRSVRGRLGHLRAERGALLMKALVAVTVFTLLGSAVMTGVSGIEALGEIKRDQPQQAVVIVTAVSEVETAVEAMRLGASDYVMKPFVLHDMLRTVDLAISEETDKVIEIPMPDADASPASMTIAVGTPAEEMPGSVPGAMGYDIELMTLAEDVEAIYEQVAALKARMDVLTRPRRMVRSLISGGPTGDDAA